MANRFTGFFTSNLSLYTKASTNSLPLLHRQSLIPGEPDSSISGNEWSEMRDQFFVFHRDSSFGIIYDPHSKGGPNVRLKVDSSLGNIRGSNNFQNLLNKRPDSISWKSQNTELREVYVEKATLDTPSVRIILYYSSKMKGLGESLNTMLDSARQMKLYKHEFIVEEFYSETRQQRFPRMKYSTEIKEMKASLPKEGMQYINGYKQRNKKDRKARNRKSD